ncbi:MAG TPA: hypothetical protein VLZ77_00635 [Acidimicrobiales bacterium]|nr:hypothetical protein [Acidimicrobiales bacterium]
MKNKLVGLGLGLALSTLGVVVAPTMASADSTCYTGCSTPSGSTIPTTPAVTQATTPTLAKTEPISSGLAFTGADIEEMAAVGAGALVLGGVLVRRSRKQRQASAAA